MSVRLVDRSFQYPVGIAKNILIEVGKFTFPADFFILEMEEDSKVPLILGRPFLHTADAVIQVKQKQLNLRVGTERMIFHINSSMKHSYSNDDTYEDSKILHSIEGTILEEKLFAKFDEFMAMTADENSKSESDTEEPQFKKITLNTYYKIKTSLEEPPTDLELKPLPDNLEYVFLEEPSFLPFIISFQLYEENKNKLISSKYSWTISPSLEARKNVTRKNVTSWLKKELCLDTRKDTENVAADHLSRMKNEETSDDSEVDDNFPGETLMKINTEDEPWFADFANYLASDIRPKGMTYQQLTNFSQTSNITSGRNPTSSKYDLTIPRDQQVVSELSAVDVPQTLEYKGGQLNSAPVLEVENFTNWKKRKPENQWTRDERKAANLDQRLKSLIMSVLPDDQMNSVINCLTAKSTWDDLILYHEGPFDVKESRVMDLKLCYNTFKFKEVRNTNHAKDYALASLFGKLKYEENLIDSIYKTEKNKSLVSATPLSTDLFSSSIVQDFQDSPDDEEDTRSSQEYINDLKKEYQARALLAKSRRFFKKGTQRFSSTKATDQTECHKCGKKGHFARDCWPTKDFEAKYNNVKAKLALLSFSASASKAPMVLMALAEENNAVGKESARNGQKDLVFVKSSANDTKVTIPGVERPWLSEVEGFILPNHDTGRILLAESKRNTTDHSVAFTDSSATDYDSADKSLVCSTPLPPLKNLEGAKPIFGPKTIKSILKSKSTLKAEALKCVIINEPSSAPAKGNKRSSASNVHSAHAGKLRVYKRTDHITCDHAEYMSTINMSQHLKSLSRASSRPNILRPSKHFFPPCIHYGSIDHLSNECLYYPICKLCGSYDHDTNGHNRIISLEREINPRNPQHTFKRCEAYGSSNHTTTVHYDIEWFKRGEALQDKKAKALKSTRAESSNANRSKALTKRHMTGVKSYLHKYVEQTRTKVVFGDDSTCTNEGYGSIKCNGIFFTKQVAISLDKMPQEGLAIIESKSKFVTPEVCDSDLRMTSEMKQLMGQMKALVVTPAPVKAFEESSPVKTSDNFVKIADELAPLDSLPPGNDDSTLKKDLHEENFQEDVEIKNSNVSDEPVLLNKPLSDKDECFAPKDDNDEIDDFLAIEVSSNEKRICRVR
ncbi:retrovirus-related pol polyprotein from transposon TNT 1-94 [Tanacetum coccineum]